MKMRVLYIGGFCMPDKNAAAQRVLGVGKLLRQCSCDVRFCGLEHDISEPKYGTIEGFSFTNYSYPMTGSNWLKYLTGHDSSIKEIKKYNPDIVILYNHPALAIERIAKFCHGRDIKVIAHDPLGFHDYNNLQMNSFAVVSDSGTLPEESSFFLSIGKPIAAVCIRTSTERPEALDKGDFVLAGIDEKSLLQAVDVAVEMNRNNHLGLPVPNYIDTNVSTKIVKLIQSYTGVVNKMVWRKF